MPIDMYRDGGTILVDLGDTLILLDNRIDSKTRGRGVWYNKFGIPVPRDIVLSVCSRVRKELMDCKHDYVSKVRVEEYLERLERNYDSVYEEPKDTQTHPAAKSPTFTLDKQYACLGELTQDEITTVLTANEYGIRIVKDDEGIGVYVPHFIMLSVDLPKPPSRSRLTKLMGCEFIMVWDCTVSKTIDWIKRVLVLINGSPNSTSK